MCVCEKAGMGDELVAGFVWSLAALLQPLPLPLPAASLIPCRTPWS